MAENLRYLTILYDDQTQTGLCLKGRLVTCLPLR